MRTITTLLILLSLTGCTQALRLYSPVYPMEDGTNITQPTAPVRNQAITRATRNAERWCLQFASRYKVVSMAISYQGVYEDAQEAEQKARKASLYTLGIYDDRRPDDYQAELVFRCNREDQESK